MSLVILGVLAASLGLAGDRLQRSPYVTKEGLRPEQPVPFSHQHHVAGLGLDCRYCHTSVENSSFAGIPPTKTCMNCHSQVWTNAEMLEPVRASYRDNKSLVWTRVHDLPDFVYFSHEIHVNKGVGCKSCHGPVDEMPLMYQDSSLQMEWCLECHRDTAKVLRPREEVFNMQYKAPNRANPVKFAGVEYFDQQKLGEAIQKQYHVRNKLELTSCETCHR
ncbi:MAG TPA: cytochrome c3 family protein [Terriglobales bacterium]|nr:cytochrome c3 family protein [Terriglobales bacterium]